MKWNRSFTGAAALAACGWLATATVFTQGNNASAQLRAAMHRETVQGDVKGAITEYRRIADGSADRAVQAQALLRLGAAYEKLGRPEARATYERVVSTYSDQPKAATAAKARLAKVSGSAVVKRAQADVTPRRVAEGVEANLLDVTPDGRWAVGTVRRGYSRWDVVIRDLTTGAVRVLVPGDTWRSGSQPRISDDGSQVAYTWTEGDGTLTAIRIVGTQPGATPRTVVSRSDINFVVLDWAPDGKSVLVAVGSFAGEVQFTGRIAHDLAWLDLASGALRAIRHFEGRQQFAVVMAPRVSPDSRYIALLSKPDATSTDTYVEVVDTDGQQAAALVATAGMRRSLMWTPDGGHLLYLEGDYTNSSLWAVPVRAGQRAGEPTMLQKAFDGTPLGVAADGSLLSHRTDGGGNYLYLLDRRPSAGAQVSKVKTLSGGGTFSKDGITLAYITGDSGNGHLIVRDLASGRERTYPHPTLRPQRPIWSEDGGTLLVTTTRGQQFDPLGDQVISSIDLRTGTYTDLFQRAEGGYRRSRGPLSPDGKTMYMARMNQERTAIADLVARDLATGEERVITAIDAGPSGDPDAGIALSPDGRTLAIMVWNKAFEEARLFTIGVDGTARREVVASFPTGWIVDDLSWNPDGQSIVFLGFDAKKDWRVMRVTAAGGTPEPDGLDYDTLNPLLGDLKLFPGNFNTFSLSPDGTKIAASTLTMAKTEVWALDVMALLAQR
jgi:Tol biopolymer transport system component